MPDPAPEIPSEPALDYGPVGDREASPEENRAAAEALVRIAAQAFLADPDLETSFLDRVGWENGRLLRLRSVSGGESRSVFGGESRGLPVGGLTLVPLRQYYGGRPVAAVGISGVAIAPEWRGQGAARTLMRRMLQELRASARDPSGTALSVLYPATQALYRGAGYEQAGLRVRWMAELSRLDRRALAPGDALAARPCAPDDPALRHLQAPFARSRNGHLERPPVLWRTLATPPAGGQVWAYAFGEAPVGTRCEDNPQGYVLLVQRRDPQGTTWLHLRDWAARTPAAIAALWRFLAAHGTQIDRVSWFDAIAGELAFGLPEAIARPERVQGWMLRVVDPAAALTQRGYPPELVAELHLELRDATLPENAGRFVAEIAGGRAIVRRGGRGDLRLDAGALAALYGGGFSARQLQRFGRLDGDDRAIARAALAFGGEWPWMPDFF